MEIKNVEPKFSNKNGKTFCYFEVSREEAIKMINKNGKTISLLMQDRRPKSYAQIKLFWGFLDEFIQTMVPKKYITKDIAEGLKKALYIEYCEEMNKTFRLKTASISEAMLFLNWVILKFAEEQGFVSQNIELQNEFHDGYVYSTLLARKCAICGTSGIVVKYGKKSICLCEKHKKITLVDLQEIYYLYPTKINEEVIKITEKEKNETVKRRGI